MKQKLSPVNPSVCIEGHWFGEYRPMKGDSPDAKLQYIFNPIGRAVKIVEVKMMLESGDVTLLVTFCYDVGKGLYLTREIPREFLAKKHFGDLLKMGIDAYEQTGKTLLKLFQNQELTAPRANIHTGLGFATETDPITMQTALIFKAYKAVGAISSTYAGSLKIEPTGEYDTWLDMVKNEVIGRPALETALVIGCAAPVKAYLNEHIGDESIIVNYCGESTSGKTTSAMLSVSTGGYPHADGLMTTWNSTGNALEGILNGNRGYPLLIDEASTNSTNGKKVDASKIVYVISGGVGKNRLNRDSTLKEPFKWSTVIISTGEESLLSLRSQNTGLLVRLIEIHIEKWTEDARNAEAIKECVRGNYGFVIPMIADYLLSIQPEDLLPSLEEYRKRYESSTSVKDEFTGRVSTTYALFLLTAEIISQVLEIDINPETVLNFFLQNEKDNDIEKDLSVRAYDYFLQAVNAHPEKFGRENFYDEDLYDNSSNVKRGGYVTEDPNYETWGKIMWLDDSEIIKYVSAGRIKTDTKIVIAEDRFIKLMGEGGFNNYKEILSKWRKSGLLDAMEDRLYRKQRITKNGAAIKTYSVFVYKTEEELAESPRPRPAKPNPKSIKPPPKPIKPPPIKISNLDEFDRIVHGKDSAE